MRLRILGLLVLFVVSSAHAASFDCAKARSADEKAICAHRPLNDLDVRMSTLYDVDRRLLAMGGRGALQDAQQVWLTQRHRCGANVACLTRSYTQRIAELQKAFDEIAAHGPF